MRFDPFASPFPLFSVLWFGGLGCLGLLSSAVRPGPGHGSGRLGLSRDWCVGRTDPIGIARSARSIGRLAQAKWIRRSIFTDRKAIRVVTKLSHGPYKILRRLARGPSKPAFPSLFSHAEIICPAAPEPKERSWPGAPRALREEAKPHRNRPDRGEAAQSLLSLPPFPAAPSWSGVLAPRGADPFRFEPRVCV